jgi:hypothetical protein
MFRIMRRGPWIALGAAGAYFFDGRNGATRREEAKAGLRSLIERMKDSGTSGPGMSGRREPRESDLDTHDAPLAPSVSDERVRSRSKSPQAEETSAGIRRPAPTRMAEQILEDSERRVTDRSGTSAESRRSEETVPPVGSAR